MITLENISSGEIVEGEEVEYFIDDETQIGEVYLDGDLIFQALDVMSDRQLEHALRLEFKYSDLTPEIYNEFNQ
jgi:hypothetical protein